MIKKSIAKVLKLVFMAMMLIAVSACDLGNTPENNGEKKYPENITTQNKKDIDAILKDSETADYGSLLTKLTKISSFLNEYVDDEKVSAYKSNLDEIISEIKNGNFTTLDSLISKVDYITPKSYTKKENTNYTNYNEYESLYNLYSQVCDEYKNYYNGEYSEKYNAYKQKYDQLSQNPEKFNELTEFMRDVVNDFKDNYVFDNTFTKAQAKDFVTNAENEQKSINKYVTELSDSTDLLNAKYSNVNAINSDLSSFKLNEKTNVNPGQEDPVNPGEEDPVNPGEEDPVNPGEEDPVNPGEEDPVNPGEEDPINPGEEDPVNPGEEDPVIPQNKTKTIYMGSASNITETDLSGFETINIAVPENSTEIDVINLYNTKMAVKNITDNMDEFIDVSFASYPETATKYKFELPEGTDNNEFMTQINNPRFSRFHNVGDSISVEMIPGVEIVATMLYNTTSSDIYRNIKFTKQNNITSVDIDLSKNEFDLTKMKDTGIKIDSNLQYNIKNLGNTTFTGELRNDSNLQKFEQMFLHNYSADSNNTELPILDNIYFRNMIGDTGYGTNIDKVISYYYKHNLGDKLNSLYSSNFDAIDYLNGKYMYNNDNSFNNAYELDMNTFMYLSNNVGNISNIKVSGENNTKYTNVNENVRLANIRFENDLSDMEFTNSENYGIFDFAGKAPSLIEKQYGRVILREGSIKNEITLGTIDNLDITELNYNIDFSKMKNLNYGTKNYVNFSSKEAADSNSLEIIIENKFINGTSYSGGSSYTSNTEIEERGRNFKRYGNVSKLIPSKSVQNKSDILRKLLDDNQKTYS